MNAKLFGLCAVVCVGAGLVLYVASESRSVSPQLAAPAEEFNFLEARKYWSARIAAIGADSAYREFIDSYKNASYNVQHPAAHLMGNLLYTELALKGMLVCDSSFGFGCYHQFFMDALGERGLRIIPALDAECLTKYGKFGTGCQHGIGHGLGEFFGYTDEGLRKALAACSETTTVTPYFGCASGVFMQYNKPVSFDGTALTGQVRSLDRQQPLYPCDTVVSEPWKTVCFYALGNWWFDNFLPVSTAGSYCQDAPSSYQDDCYLGVGSALVWRVGYDIASVKQSCAEMPQQGRALCRAGAAWSFFEAPQERKKVEEICLEDSSRERSVCRERSDLLGNGEIFSYGH